MDKVDEELLALEDLSKAELSDRWAKLDATRLVGLRDIPLAWEEQEKLLLTA